MTKSGVSSGSTCTFGAEVTCTRTVYESLKESCRRSRASNDTRYSPARAFSGIMKLTSLTEDSPTARSNGVSGVMA